MKPHVPGGWLGIIGAFCIAVADLGVAAAFPPAAERSAVDDGAKRLGPYAPLVARMASAFRRDLGVDVRVVMLAAAAEPVAPLAERLFRERGVGDGAPVGGVLILLVSASGEARIEVSYTLEGIYPDVVLARLAREQLAPFARHGAAGMAVMDVVHLLRDRALDAVAAHELVLPPRLAAGPAVRDALAGRSGGGGAEVRLDQVPADAAWKRPVPAAERARYAPSADPRESAAAYQRVLHDQVGDPTLDLFTPASCVMRARSPMAPFEERYRLEALARAGTLRLRVAGDFAVLQAERPVRGLVPILLRRDDGLWRVDLVATYKNFFFDSHGVFFLWNAANPYAFAFDTSRAPRRDALDPLPLGGEPLEVALERLAATDGADARLRLAELLFRNTWLVSEALARYEEAARLAPGSWTIVTTLAERASYVGMPDLAIPYVEALGPPGLARLGELHEQAGRPERAAENFRRALARDAGDERARAGLDRLRRSSFGRS